MNVKNTLSRQFIHRLSMFKRNNKMMDNDETIILSASDFLPPTDPALSKSFGCLYQACAEHKKCCKKYKKGKRCKKCPLR